MRAAPLFSFETTRAAALALALVLSGCGRSDVYRYPVFSEDAGRPDSGTPDAGPGPCDDVVCDANAHCQAGACHCDDGFELDGGSCHSIAVTLAGLRWELPCVQPWPQAPTYVCITTADVTRSAKLGGSPARLYEIVLRLRGVVETKAYLGGATQGATLSLGGTPVDDAWNVYRLQISAPSTVWYVNRGSSGEYLCHAIDELLTVRANGGATFTLFASAVDSNRTEIRNLGLDGGSFVIPGVDPAPKPFDGQFLQMDVVSVRALP